MEGLLFGQRSAFALGKRPGSWFNGEVHLGGERLMVIVVGRQVVTAIDRGLECFP